MRRYQVAPRRGHVVVQPARCEFRFLRWQLIKVLLFRGLNIIRPSRLHNPTQTRTLYVQALYSTLLYRHSLLKVPNCPELYFLEPSQLHFVLLRLFHVRLCCEHVCSSDSTQVRVFIVP